MDLLDLLTELLTFPENDGKRSNKSVFKTLSILLIIAGTIWLVYELPAAKKLAKPFVFISVSLLVSLGIALLFILALFAVKAFKSIRPIDFMLIILAISINVFCSLSYLNRQLEYKWMEKQPDFQQSGNR